MGMYVFSCVNSLRCILMVCTLFVYVVYFNKKFKIKSTAPRHHFQFSIGRIKKFDNTLLARELSAIGCCVIRICL